MISKTSMVPQANWELGSMGTCVSSLLKSVGLTHPVGEDEKKVIKLSGQVPQGFGRLSRTVTQSEVKLKAV